MAHRGQFVTQQIDCDACYEKVRRALAGNTFLEWTPIEMRAFAGRTRGSYPWAEVHQLSLYTFDEEGAPCHQVRIAVITDIGGLAYLYVEHDGSVKEHLCFQKSTD